MAGFRQTIRDLLQSLRHRETPHREMAWPLSEAKTCGLQLLVRCLSPAQRDQFETCRYFDVIGGDSGTHYRIRYGAQMNIERLDHNDRRVEFLCFTPEGRLPVSDVMLAQKIGLELFESEAVRVANSFPSWELGFDLGWARRLRQSVGQRPLR